MENAVEALKMAFAVFVFVISLTIAITMFGQLNDVSQVVLASSDETNFYDYEVVEDSGKTRIVGLETVIPTLYKYYKENYTVLFLDVDGTPLPLYNSQTDRALWGTGVEIDETTGVQTKKNKAAGIIGKYYKGKQYYEPKNGNDYRNYDNAPDTEFVCSFDVEEETLRHEPWTGKSVDFKINLDKFLQGGYFVYPSGGADKFGFRGYNYGKQSQNYGASATNNKKFIEAYEKRQFKEMLGEYYYNLDTTAEDYNAGLQKNRKKRIIIYQLQP